MGMDKNKVLDILLKLERQRLDLIQYMYENDPTGRHNFSQDPKEYKKLARIEKKITRQKNIVLGMMIEGADTAFQCGVEAAADVAREYNSSSTHPYDLGDCILGKLNQIGKRKIRKNKQKREL